MALYTGKPAIINRPVEEVYGRFSDFSSLKDILDKLPEDQKGQIGELKFDSDSLTIVTQQVGEVKFVVTERVAPSKVVLSAEKSPIPLSMIINLKEAPDNATEISTSLDVEIPAMMRAFIGPKLQQVADKFGESMLNLGK